MESTVYRVIGNRTCGSECSGNMGHDELSAVMCIVYTDSILEVRQGAAILASYCTDDIVAVAGLVAPQLEIRDHIHDAVVARDA